MVAVFDEPRRIAGVVSAVTQARKVNLKECNASTLRLRASPRPRYRLEFTTEASLERLRKKI